MTREEHIAEAERLLVSAGRYEVPYADHLVAKAQVHATLAVARVYVSRVGDVVLVNGGMPS